VKTAISVFCDVSLCSLVDDAEELYSRDDRFTCKACTDISHYMAPYIYIHTYISRGISSGLVLLRNIPKVVLVHYMYEICPNHVLTRN